MRAYATVQQLLFHGRYCELTLSLARTSCRLSSTARPPAARPAASPPAGDPARFKNPSKSTLAHDAVAAAVLHKHHLIIRIGAGLIQFVYGSHSRLTTGVTHKFYFRHFFARVSPKGYFRGWSLKSNSAGSYLRYCFGATDKSRMKSGDSGHSSIVL